MLNSFWEINNALIRLWDHLNHFWWNGPAYAIICFLKLDSDSFYKPCSSLPFKKKFLCNQIPNSCFAFFLPLSPCSLIDWLILEHSSSESSLSTPLFFQRTWFWMLSFIKFACQWIHNFSFLLTLYLILQLWGFLPIFPLSSVPSAKCSAYSLVLLVHISTI